MELLSTMFDSEALDTADRCEHLIVAAEMEIKALMGAINGSYERLIADTAAEYWVKELDSLAFFTSTEGAHWRKCTISTLSRLYRDGHLS